MKYILVLLIICSLSAKAQIDTCRPQKFDANTGRMLQGFPMSPCFTGERDTVIAVPFIKVRHCESVGMSNPPSYFFEYTWVPDKPHITINDVFTYLNRIKKQ
jgi:hypothetical protein